MEQSYYLIQVNCWIQEQDRSGRGGIPCWDRVYPQSQQSPFTHTNATTVVAMVLSGGRRKQRLLCVTVIKNSSCWFCRGIEENLLKHSSSLLSKDHIHSEASIFECPWYSQISSSVWYRRYIDITQFHVLVSLSRDLGSTMKSLSQLLQHPLQGWDYNMHSNIPWMDMFLLQALLVTIV